MWDSGVFLAVRRVVPVFCACLVAVLSVTPSASAAQTHGYVGSIGEGELGNATSVAVDSAGDVYVADQGSGLLHRYTAAGVPVSFSGGRSTLGPFKFLAGSQSQVAVDDSSGARAGDIYVIAGAAVRSYDSTGEPAPFAAQSSYAAGNLLLGDPNGDFQEVAAVAVDPNGYIYISTGTTVEVFTPGGEYLATAYAYQTKGLAVDTAGTFYGASVAFSILNGFVPSAYPPEASTYYNTTYPPTPNPKGVGVGPSDSLLVDDGAEIHEYAANAATNPNEPLDTFGAGHLSAAAGVGVDPATGDVYVADGERVQHFGPSVTVPTVTTGAPTAVDSATGSATLNGTVEPAGGPVTECFFEYGDTEALGQTVPCAESAASINSGTPPVAVHADLNGLAVGNYSFRLVVANASGQGVGQTRTFAITGPPTVVSESAEAGSTKARLSAAITSGNQQATYRFEYGLTPTYGTSTASGSVGGGADVKTVSIGVSNLTPATTYHYRVVVSNAAGSVAGPDQTFVTGPAAVGGSCPNEELRKGESAYLPECRAYEMVSPVDKNGGEVFPLYIPQSTASGEAIGYLSDAPFPGVKSNNLLNAYIGTRSSADGGSWSTQTPDPPNYNEHGLLEVSTLAFDRDFTKALQVSRLVLAPGAEAGQTNIYIHDLANGSYVTVATVPGAYFMVFTQLPTLYVGGTPDWSRIVMKSEVPLLPGLPRFQTLGYEYVGGKLRVLTMPDGEVPSESLGTIQTAKDGDRTFFAVGVNGAIYVADGSGTTRLVSHAHMGGAAHEEEPAYAEIKSFSNDGSVLYFTAAEGLVPGSAEEGLFTLYRWDAEGDRLQEVTPNLGAGGYTRVTSARTDADGSFVYFSTTAALTPDAPKPTGSSSDLYVWHGGPDGGSLEYILETDPDLTGEEVGPPVLVSPDGRTVGIQSLSRLTPDVVRGPQCPDDPVSGTPHVCQNVFVFDYATKELRCATCSATPAGNSWLPEDFGGPLRSGGEARAVLDDGQVFFTTPNALASRDSNRAVDVYEWSDGRAQLISSGTGEGEALFAGASSDGQNVFFKTAQPLVAQDDDTVYDLYDARVDGGIAAQNVLTEEGGCKGEACRGRSPSPVEATGRSEAESPRCVGNGRRAQAIARHASALSHRAGKLTKAARSKRSAKARRASLAKAKQLRKQAGQLRRQAKKLRSNTDMCGRQG